MKNGKNIATAIALALCMSLGTTACTSHNVTYRNEQNKETFVERNHTTGTIDIPFKVSPTLDSKATAKIEGVDKILDSDTSGVLATNKDKNQLYRIVNGTLVWASEILPTPVITAQFVQESERVWIVASRQDQSNLELLVYDAYAQGANQTALRKKTFANGKSIISPQGIITASDSGVARYYPNNGTVSQLTFPQGTTLLATLNTGYLVTADNHIALASTNPSNSWSSISHLPNGFTSQAKNSLIVSSPSTLAVKWTEGNKNTIAFTNPSTGEIIAQYDGNLDTDGRKIIVAESSPHIALGNVLVNTAAKTTKKYDKPIIAIVDDLVYFNDGTAKDIDTDRDAWNSQDNGEIPALIFQRDSFFLKNNTLYVVPLRYTPQPTSNDQSSSTKTPSASPKK